jgi:hypothetical protein
VNKGARLTQHLLAELLRKLDLLLFGEDVHVTVPEGGERANIHRKGRVLDKVYKVERDGGGIQNVKAWLDARLRP